MRHKRSKSRKPWTVFVEATGENLARGAHGHEVMRAAEEAIAIRAADETWTKQAEQPK